METLLRKTRGGPRPRTRDEYLEAGREYVRLYGADELTASAFSPAAALRGRRQDKAERYLRGRPNPDGSFPAGTKEDPPNHWPSLNAIKAAFGGFTNFRKELGLPPNGTCPPRGRRKAGEAAPIENVRIERVYVPVESEQTAFLRGQLRAQERRAARLGQQLDEAQRRLAETQAGPAVDAEQVEEIRRRLQDERSRRRVVQRELHNAERREIRARAREDALRAAARGDANLLREVDRLTHELAKAQAALAELRGERPGTIAREARRVETKTVTKTVTLVDEKARRQAERALARQEELRDALARSEALRVELSDRLAEIRREAVVEALALGRVREAERRAEAAEARARELGEVLLGSYRRPTLAELAALRRDGPAGDALWKAATKQVLRALAEGSRRAQYDALTSLLEATWNWRSRL